MAMIEYRCKKCGNTFIDDEETTTHFQLVNNDGVDHGPCGGEGEPQYEFSDGFSNRS